MATHDTILAWKIPWTEEPGRLQSMGSDKSDTTEYAQRSQFPSIVSHNPDYNHKLISKPYAIDSEIKTKCRVTGTAEFKIWKGPQRA